MAPLIAGLLANGLNLLGNAVLAKGKEWVEEKTGVTLDESKPIDPETAAKLKVAEMAHEEELLRIQQEDDRLQKEIEEMYLRDVSDARKREADIATSAEAPMLNKVITPILALIVTLGGGAIVTLSTNADVRMAAFGAITMVLGYYFGTSQGSTKANQLFRDMARKNGAG